MRSPAPDDQFQRPAYLAGHAGNVTEPATALLVLEVTLDTGQRLTRPAAHDGIPHIHWQTSARALPLSLKHPRPGPASASSEWHRTPAHDRPQDLQTPGRQPGQAG
jgi:hypothetical protein